MGTKKGDFIVGEKDIADPERIENHLKNLSLAGTVLAYTANPQRGLFKIGELSRSTDTLKLIAVHECPPFQPDEIVTFIYFSGHEPYRFGQRVIAADHTHGVLIMHFPLIIRSNERRAGKRFNFPKREDIHTAIITDLANGVGASGPLHDLGIGGGAFQVEKVVLIPSGKEIHVSSESLKAGRVALIRFRLPGGLEIEAGGNLIHTWPEAPTFRAGFQFGQKPANMDAGLKMFLEKKFS